MNSLNVTSFNHTNHKGYAFIPTEEPLYRQYKPVARDLIPLPKSVLYMLMAAVVVVAVAYAIVGHLIKDLAIDIAECMIGPAEDPTEKASDLKSVSPTHISSGMNHFNAFHVWDADEVIFPMPDDESPLGSPLLMSAMPYIPFFPAHSSYSSPALLGSPNVITARPQDI